MVARYSMMTVLLTILLGLPSTTSSAQSTDSVDVQIPEVTVESSRRGAVLSQAAFAVSMRKVDEIDKPYSELGLKNLTGSLPGLFISPRHNPSVGDRIIIRGAGWRSQFGVRGVKVVLDGQPLTMPDGQSVLDVVDTSLINRVELLRGTASSLWGNSTGGVLSLFTQIPATNTSNLSFSTGSFGLLSGSANVSLARENSRHLFSFSHLELDGYRDYSETTRSRLSAISEFSLGDESFLRWQTFWLHTPTSNNPGSLSTGLLEENRSQAFSRNFDAKAGKSFDHLISSLSFNKNLESLNLNAQVFGGIRSLDNPLSFTFIDLNRKSIGARISAVNLLDGKSDEIQRKVSFGLDTQFQMDDRKNIDHDQGIPSNDLTLSQKERIGYFAGFGTYSYKLHKLFFDLGSRVDFYSYNSDDQLLSNGDQSGSRTFFALSPSASLSFQVNQRHTIYGGYSNSFETPTTTELVNNPEQLGGFNNSLLPQKSKTRELGARGRELIGTNLVEYDVAFFSMNISDGLIPFQISEDDDRTYFRNGAKAFHDGFEGRIAIESTKGLGMDASLSIGKYQQQVDEEDDPKLEIPGLPANQAKISIYNTKGLIRSKTSIRSQSKIFTNSANTVESSGYTIVDTHIRFGSSIAGGKMKLSPFFSIENVLNTDYIGSVVINAFGGRYFEPAPPRSFLIGLNISFF